MTLLLPSLFALAGTLVKRCDDEHVDDDTSVGEEEGESYEAEKRADNSMRARWTTVEQMRSNDTAGRERENAADDAALGHGREPAI